MAYNVVAQGEHWQSVPNPTTSPGSQGDLNGGARHFTTGQLHHSDEPFSGRLGSIIHSLTSTNTGSYDMIEADDYDELPTTPLRIISGDVHEATPTRMTHSPPPPLPPPHAFSPERTVPYRTASISRGLPLQSPSVQSLQGVKNVERLEDSAERLSMTSSLEDELQKVKQDQKRLERNNLGAASQRALAPLNTRQPSAGPFTNSIIGVNGAARSGGYSPSRYVGFPRAPVPSASWSQPPNLDRSASKSSQTTKPRRYHSGREARPLNHITITTGDDLLPSQDLSSNYERDESMQQGVAESPPAHSIENNSDDRPSTSASNGTYRRATNLFIDFDGVHYTPHYQTSVRSEASRTRRISLSQPPLASGPNSFEEPQPGEEMVYYPAPVPMMLNLPQRLSKLPPASAKEKRRLRGISGIPHELRKSALWLKNDVGEEANRHRSTVLYGLPPQLRASAFFDQPSASQDIKVQGSSAVATLDSILDASAHAPVSAFTDHPIAGHLGREVYGNAARPRKSVNLEKNQKARRRSSLSNVLKTATGLTSTTRLPSDNPSTAAGGRVISRESRAFGDHQAQAGEALNLNNEGEEASAHAITPDEEEIANEERKDENSEDDEDEGETDEDEAEEEDDMNYIGAPTTLLAELQLRKAQQKQRNRTAATAFPDGMHSTLLELDAVAQVQQKSRKQKHVTLAWEDHDLADQQNFDDEDVPLGVLVPQAKNNINRPVGLLERREIEDNEPLSHRRARLRGEPLRPEASLSVKPGEPDVAPTLDLPGVTDQVLDEPEEESLAERVKRLKAQKTKPQDVATDFTAEISSQLGLKTEVPQGPSGTPDQEETLGQRRKRLQQEAQSGERQVSGDSSPSAIPFLRTRHSLADVLTAYPAAGSKRPVSDARGLTLKTTMPRLGMQRESTASSQCFAHGLSSTAQFPHIVAMANPSNHAHYGGPMLYNQSTVGGQYAPQGVSPFIQDPMMGPPLDPKQRAVIDQWRQGIVQ